jgi:hypothetical protein
MGTYAYLTSTEQWQLHDYFQPSKYLADTELLEHRKKISKERPSLPHQAGRALAKLERHAARLAVQHAKPAALSQPVQHQRRGKDRVITVRSVVRPEPDLKLLARAIVMLAYHLDGAEPPAASPGRPGPMRPGPSSSASRGKPRPRGSSDRTDTAA